MNSQPSEKMKFERWMKRYWSGVPVIWLNDVQEYEGQVQIAWDVWVYRHSARGPHQCRDGYAPPAPH